MGEKPKPGAALTNEPRRVEPPKPDATPAAGTLAPDTDRDPDQRLRAALEASTRTEASLTALMRAVEQVTTGVSGAQQANERLSVELATARELLAEANGQRAALEQRASALEESLRRTEQALGRLREESERDRQFMVDEQDRFLAGLLAEHEEQIAAVRRELHELRTQSGERVPPAEKKTLPGVPKAPEPPQELAALRAELGSLQAERQRSRELMRKVQAQRDEAQETVSRLTSECEEAKAEIARLSSLAQAPPELTATPCARAAVRVEQPTPRAGIRPGRTQPHWSHSDSAVTDAHERATAPPIAAAIEAALMASRKPSPPPSEAAADSAPTIETVMAGPPPTPLLRKQDPQQRSVGGYSVGPDQIEPERIDARPGSKPPRG